MTATSNETSTLQRGGPLQRKTIWVLIAGTILGGLGVGASLSVGALLLAEVSGNDAISGLSSTMFGVGAAAAGIPLARLAAKRGRRKAIVSGNLIAAFGALTVVVAATMMNWWLIMVGIALVGVASAVQLMARFTATDLAEPQQRARDLSLVVWSITIGAVSGPFLLVPGEKIGSILGIPELAGAFAFTFIAQLLAAAISWSGLKPDPLLTARALPPEPIQSNSPAAQRVSSKSVQKAVIAIIAISQAVMVGLMAMTPLHLMHHGGTHGLVALTLSLHIAGMYALSPVFGMLAAKFGRIPVIHLGWLILLVTAFLAFIAGGSHAVTITALTLLGLGWSAVTVAGATLITELTPAKDRTQRQGQSDTFMSAAGAAAGALSGVGFSIAGFPLLAVVSALLVVIGFFVVLWVSAQVRKTSVRHE